MGSRKDISGRGSSEKLTEYENIRHGVGGVQYETPILVMLREGVIITLREAGFVDNNQMI